MTKLNGMSFFQVYTKVSRCQSLGFNAKFMGHNSIQIAQILNVYNQTGQVDLIVGFRRDQHALKVYRQTHTFKYMSQEFQVQVAEGFKTYLDDLNQKYRQQTAERQKMRAEQNKVIKLSQVSKKEQSPKVDPVFIRLASNSISHITSPSKKQIEQEEQGQILDSDSKSEKSRDRSNLSYSIRSVISEHSEKQKKKNTLERKSSQKKADSSSYKGFYIQQRSDKKKYYYSRSSSSSRYSRSSSSGVKRKHHNDDKKDRYDRSRHKKYEKKHSSSSSDSPKYEKGRNQGRDYSDYQSRKRSDYRFQQDKRYDENRKYQLPQSLNRGYSYNQKYRQQSTVDLNRKYSQEQQYNPYRAPYGRYQSQYYDYSRTQNVSYNYYKKIDDNSYQKQPSSSSIVEGNNITVQKLQNTSQYNKYGVTKNQYYSKPNNENY